MMTCCQNTLKLTNQHVEIQKFAPGVIPPDPLKGMGSRGKDKKFSGEYCITYSTALWLMNVPDAVYTSAMSVSGTLKNVLKTS